MYKKVLALVLATVLLSGCSISGGNSESTEDTDSTDVSSESSSLPQSATQNSDNISEPQTESSVTKTNNSSEESEPVKTGGMPAEISDYINSLDNGDFVFVDYTFDENPDVITDVSLLGDIYDKALAVLKENDDYKSFVENFPSAELFGMLTENVEDYLDENGEPVPIFKRAITDDFDRDGNEESLVMIAIPKIRNIDFEDTDWYEKRWWEREYLFLVNKNGAVLLEDYYNAKITAILDYGCCKQIVIDSEGWPGYDNYASDIWGVRDGEAVKLYGGRLDFSKTDCFLYSAGQQFIGDFAVYDINNGEYLAIQGKELNAEDICAMDSDNVIRDACNDNIASAVLLGGKYFIINENGVYTYANGRFERSDKKVRGSDTPGNTGDALHTLDDVDYDAALASMLTPEEVSRLER